MIEFLEPKPFEPYQCITNELDECLEIFFVLSGKFDVGYNINNRKFYRLRFVEGRMINAFNVHFDRRSEFMIRAFSFVNCFAYRKANWKQLMALYPDFERQIKITIFSLYEKQIRIPMMKKRKQHLEQIKKRNDY